MTLSALPVGLFAGGVPGGIRDPIEARERLVEEGVVRRDQLRRGPVILDDLPEKGCRLFPHRRAKLGAEGGETDRIGGKGVEAAQLQPLGKEILDKGEGLWVGEHAPHLGLKIRRELSLGGERQEIVIGH